MKDLINSYSFNIRTNDLDYNDDIRPAAVLDFFQAAASRHAEEIGTGYQKLLDKNLAWVLVKTKYKVFNRVSLYDTITTTTWPMPTKRIEYDRSYRINDKSNNVLIEGLSMWCIVDAKEHRISREKVEFDGIIHDEDLNIEFDNEFSRQKDFSGFDYVYDYKVHICDLDHNHHMNNSKYGDVILNTLDLNTFITEFEISYLKECQLNDVIKVYKKQENDIIKIVGLKEDNTISFKSILKVQK